MRALVVGGVSWNRILHLDRLPEPVPHTVHAHRTYEALGGTGAGKAWNLAALGWDVDLVAAIGDDDAGRRVRSALDVLGVRVHALVDPAGTEQHTNLMAPDGSRLSIYTNSSSADLELDVESIVTTAHSADLVCVNILGHCRTVLRPLVDSGVRVWTDLHDHDGVEPYHRAFTEAASAIQVSSDRMADWRAWSEGRLMSDDELVGTELVVVTHGTGGADASTGAGWHHAPAQVVDAVDTNGAGDAFFAGFVTARSAGADLDGALAGGAEAAARCVASEGLGPAF